MLLYGQDEVESRLAEEAVDILKRYASKNGGGSIVRISFCEKPYSGETERRMGEWLLSLYRRTEKSDAET